MPYRITSTLLNRAILATGALGLAVTLAANAYVLWNDAFHGYRLLPEIAMESLIGVPALIAALTLIASALRRASPGPARRRGAERAPARLDQAAPAGAYFSGRLAEPTTALA